MLFIAWKSEYIVARVHRASSVIPDGLHRTLELALSGDIEKQWPHLLVFSDPSPNALIIRSWGGSGTILVSQGLVALLNEEELRAILQLCVLRLKEPGIAFQSFCFIFALGALSFAPRPWVNLVFTGRTLPRVEERLLGPCSALGFLVLFPVVRFFLYFGRSPIRSRTTSQLGGIYSAAMQKVAQAIHIWGPGKNYGIFSLYFIHPNSGEMLFPNC
jgi:hypothetical protein